MSEPFNRSPAEPALRERVMPVGNVDAFPPPTPATPTVAPVTASGWQCPACAGVYAPWVQSCPNCRPDVMKALKQVARVET